MDQNQTTNNYQKPHTRSYAADFRARARAALRGNWAVAIGILLLAGILGGIVGGISTGFSFSSSDMKSVVETVQEKHLLENPDALREYIQSFFSTSSVFSVLLLFVGVFTLLVLVRNLFVGSPVMLGYERFHLNLIDGKNEHAVGTLFRYFGICYWKSVGLNVLYNLLLTVIGIIPVMVCFIAFLAMLAFGMAGPVGIALAFLVFSVLMVAWTVLMIAIEYSYAFSFMIMAEYPQLSPVDAMRNSRHLMKGNKWRLFCLRISFIGWILLASFCTCGIGLLWVLPYVRTADAAFYDEIANREQARETEFPSINPDDYIPGN